MFFLASVRDFWCAMCFLVNFLKNMFAARTKRGEWELPHFIGNVKRKCQAKFPKLHPRSIETKVSFILPQIELQAARCFWWQAVRSQLGNHFSNPFQHIMSKGVNSKLFTPFIFCVLCFDLFDTVDDSKIQRSPSKAWYTKQSENSWQKIQLSPSTGAGFGFHH